MSNKILAVLLHLGNTSLLDYFLEKIKNIDIPYDLYISYKGQSNDILINNNINSNVDLKILSYPCDHDISGFLSMIEYIFDSGKRYYYLIFLHTKSDRIWRENLVNTILDSTSTFRENLLDFILSKNIGMLGSRIYRMSLDEYNEPILTSLCYRLGIEINSKSKFVAGTMFMIRFLIIEELYKRIVKAFGSFSNFHVMIEKKKLNNNMFPTYTHSMERIFGFITESMNYKIYFK